MSEIPFSEETIEKRENANEIKITEAEIESLLHPILYSKKYKEYIRIQDDKQFYYTSNPNICIVVTDEWLKHRPEVKEEHLSHQRCLVFLIWRKNNTLHYKRLRSGHGLTKIHNIHIENDILNFTVNRGTKIGNREENIPLSTLFEEDENSSPPS